MTRLADQQDAGRRHAHRVIGYLRVSTDAQAERGLGLDIQERAIRAWAKERKYRLVGIERDEGVSGSNGLADRVGLADALEALRDGKGQGLVVYRLDRLARDLIVQEQVLAEVRRLGADVFSTAQSETGYLADDPDDPSRKLIRQVLGAVAEYERSMIALRMRSGRRRKAERGGFAYGSPPLGYAAKDRKLVADPEEQRAIARIRELHEQGASLRAIAATLTVENIKPKRGRRWHPTTVARVLNRGT
jgi:DNA invertase Pin-like site-specific DNA recombinase